MKPNWGKFVFLLDLLRLELVLSAISGSCLVVIFARDVEVGMHVDAPITQLPLLGALALAATAAAGLTIYATCLNDILDVRRDRSLRRRRPIGDGQISMRTAVIIALIALLAGIGAAVCFGKYPTLVAIVAAVAILFYNTFARFIPAVGMVSLGLIRAMVMLIPCPFLGYVWPVCIAMGHMTVACSLAYLVSGRRPRMTANQIGMTVAGLLFWSLLLARTMVWRDTLHTAETPNLWLGVIGSMVIFCVITFLLLKQSQGRSPGARRRAARQLYQLAMLWLIVYDACWLLGVQQTAAAVASLVLFIAGWLIIDSLNTLRILSQRQLGYRVRQQTREL